MRGVFSIGHSNHTGEVFLELLKRHAIKAVVDVRSLPYSRFAPQFNKKRLEEALPKAGIGYLFLGDLLGGMPEGERFYDAEGYVKYDVVAETAAFQEGIERLIEAAKECRVAVLCAEKEPEQCHRKLLITPVLTAQGIEVRHIRADGSVEVEAGRRETSGGQGELFQPSDLQLGRSPKPVRRKK